MKRTTNYNYNTHEHVCNIHSAPTDESVRLLMELEKKAEDRLVSIHKLENNAFNASWHVFDDFMNHQCIVKCRYMWNGEENSFEFSVPICPYMSPGDFGDIAMEKLKDEVAEKLLYDLISNKRSKIAEIWKSR